MLTLDPHKPGHDHVTVRYNGKFIGFKGLKSDRICVERCGSCGKENYAMAVLSGQCCWCGWDPNISVSSNGDAR